MNVYLLQIVNGIGVGMLYFLLAVGLSIVFGLLRFVNFAHGAFYLLGAYLCYQALQWSANFWVALAVVPLVVGAFAWGVEKLVLRHVYAQQHEFHILATVGLALVLQECAILAWGPLGDNVPPPDALNGVVIWGGFVYPKYRLFVIAFTAVLAAPIRGVDPFMGIEALGIAFVVVVVGGMGNFLGALVGGLLVGIVQSLMSTLWPEGARLMIYVAMAAVLLLRPNGLLGRAA